MSTKPFKWSQASFLEGSSWVAAIFVIVPIVVLAIGALNGWLIMLAIGILAANDVVPSTIGMWWDAFWLGTVVSLLLIRKSWKNKS